MLPSVAPSLVLIGFNSGCGQITSAKHDSAPTNQTPKATQTASGWLTAHSRGDTVTNGHSDYRDANALIAA